jgi:tRNA A-37 threonylcarbamoyl transferase component Bud32
MGENINQINRFLAGESKLTVPFDIELDKQSYQCEKVLRLLPGKRLVLKAKTNDKTVLIKLFAADKKGLRESKREQAGYKLATNASVTVPKLLYVIGENNGCYAVVYNYIDNAQTISYEQKDLLSLILFVADLHQAGLFQEDFHLNNVLCQQEKLFLIDLASVQRESALKPLSKKKSLKNVAKLIAQFNPLQQKKLVSILNDYYQVRGWHYSDDEQQSFVDTLKKAWGKRKNIRLSKCFRDCTLTKYKKNWRVEYGLHRDFFEQVGPQFITNIDELIAQAQLIKDGNSSTVVTTNYAGMDLVIKRYNIKNIWHFIRRCLRPSRAAHSWKYANLLEILGIDSPQCYGFIEKRMGPFRVGAYLITKQAHGAETLANVYSQRAPSEIEIEQLNKIFVTFQSYQISHGDLKASNFLLNSQNIIELIDLDSMQQHQSRGSFNKAFIKDKKRFLKNWQDMKIESTFDGLFYIK